MYLPNKQNIADSLSRSRSLNDYRLNPQFLFEAMQRMNLKEITTDMFASLHNRNHNNYISMTYEPEAISMDAMSVDWKILGNLPYANPPFKLIPALIQKFKLQAKSPLLLVFPYWHRPWLQEILKLAATVLVFPQAPNLFLPPPHMTTTLYPPHWKAGIALLMPLVQNL